MPNSREIAQRYAAASRKRRRGARTRPLLAPPAGQSTGPAAVAGPTPQPVVETASLASGPRVQRQRGVPRRLLSDYRGEYAYVPKELRRIAAIAIALFAALIVLSFVVR